MVLIIDGLDNFVTEFSHNWYIGHVRYRETIISQATRGEQVSVVARRAAPTSGNARPARGERAVRGAAFFSPDPSPVAAAR